MLKGSKEYRLDKISEMLNWTLNEKIDHALLRIWEFYQSKNGMCYVAFSGGKDSVVLLHMVRRLYPDVEGVFSNTTNELPEILEHVRNTENITWVHPKMTFIQTIEKYGFPLVSKLTVRKVNDMKNRTGNNELTYRLRDTGINSKGEFKPSMKLSNKWKFLVKEEFDVTGKCCDILKKEPMNRYSKETNKYPFIGTQIKESDSRKVSWINNGCNIYNGKSISSRPLSIWTEKDIWDYIIKYNVKYSSAYDNIVDENGKVVAYGEKRTGCAYCAFGAHLEKPDANGDKRFDRLAKRKPHLFKKMMALENNGKSFAFALDKIGLNVDKFIE